MVHGMSASGSEVAQPAPATPDFLEGFIAEEVYAARRGASLRTCQRDRQLRQSPPYIAVGRKVYYRVEAVRGWLLAREHSGERKAAAPRARRGR